MIPGPLVARSRGGNLNLNDDAMSVSSIAGLFSLKRARAEQDSASDSDIGSRGHKVLRSRTIGLDNDGPGAMEPPIVLSDSPENVASKVVSRKKNKNQSAHS